MANEQLEIGEIKKIRELFAKYGLEGALQEATIEALTTLFGRLNKLEARVKELESCNAYRGKAKK